MTQEEYLKSLGKNSSSELSDKQILHYFIEGNAGYTNKVSALRLTSKDLLMNINFDKGVKLFRRVFNKGGTLTINYIECEGVLDEGNEFPKPHYEMKIV